MWLEIALLIPIISILFCVITGLILFRRIQGSFRLLVIHAISALVITITGIAVVKLSHGHSNQIYYNFYLPVDFLLMLFATRMTFGRHFRTFSAISILVFFIAWSLSLSKSGMYLLANQAIVVSSLILAVAYFLVLLRNTQRERSPFTAGIYSIAIFVILFYSCTIPSFGLMHYINQRDAKLAGQLYYINNILSSLRYIFTGIGLIYLSRSTTSAIHAYR